MLLAVAVLVSIGVLGQVGRNRIDAQVSRDLDTAAADLRVRLQQVQPTLGRPGGPTLAGVFDDYLRARPARATRPYLAFVGGKPFAASAGSRVALQRLPVAARWATLATTDSGQVGTPAGSLRWLAVPVRSGDRVLGVLVATELLSGQQHALQGTIVTVSLVMVLVLAGACLLAWGAGRSCAGARARPRGRRRGRCRRATTWVPASRCRATTRSATSARPSTACSTGLQVAFDSQRRFLDGAAHELRTPITIVRGHVELLDDDPDEQAATIALVLDEMDRMDRLVEELRVLAQVGATRLPLPGAGRGRRPGRGGRAQGARRWRCGRGRCGADATAVVRGDRQRLTQALLNLVDNAIHVTDDGDLIEIGAERRGHEVVLWVRDDGPGIAADDLATLFDREGRTVRRRPGGTGLGLPIVAAIARAHGGRPAVVSEPGAGTRFELLLPEAER